MGKPLSIGERVSWTVSDHGKQKKLKGVITGINKSSASVDVDGKTVTTLLARLNRCRGRKPVAKEDLPF